MSDPSAAPAGVKGEVLVEEPDRAERTIARRSAEARATVPDLELTADVALQRWFVEDETAQTAALIKACAHALKEVPRANGSYRDGRLELYSRINIGVTLTPRAAYTVPTVFDCDSKTVRELADELATLERRAHMGELLAPELAGATFTIWNPGRLGVATATPVIVPPQAAALAAGAVRELPAIRNGAIVPSHSMTITLACDHRILYGAAAARFIVAIKARLEEGPL